MKKLHITLTILNIISIILLIQIVLGWIPSFECNYSIDKIDKINSLIVDLSIGVITSTLFYYLLVVIPETKKKKTIRAINQPALNIIVNSMQEIVAYFVFSYSIPCSDDHYVQIDTKYFNNISNLRQIYTNFWFNLGKSIDSITDVSLWSEIDYIYSRLNRIEYFTKEIISLPISINEDEKLISIIANINKCSFIQNVKLLHSNKSTELSVSNLNKSITDFHTQYTLLLKYVSPVLLTIKGKKDPTKIPIRISMQ